MALFFSLACCEFHILLAACAFALCLLFLQASTQVKRQVLLISPFWGNKKGNAMMHLSTYKQWFAKSLLGAAAAAALGAPALVQAATTSSQFNVTIRIMPVCMVSTGSGGQSNWTSSTSTDLKANGISGEDAAKKATPTPAGADIDFGKHLASHATNVDAESAAGTADGIQVRCSKGTSYTISLSPKTGNDNAGGGTMQAVKIGGITNTDTIPYKLYKDSGRLNAWGDSGTNILTGQIGAGTAVSNTQKYPVYGRVLGTDLNKTPDRYADTVTVTVTY